MTDRLPLADPGRRCGGCEGRGAHWRYCPARPDLAQQWAEFGPPRRVGRVHVCAPSVMQAPDAPCSWCGRERPGWRERLGGLPGGPCLLCEAPHGTHRFAVVGGPDGWLCETHKDDPVSGHGERARR